MFPSSEAAKDSVPSSLIVLCCRPVGQPAHPCSGGCLLDMGPSLWIQSNAPTNPRTPPNLLHSLYFVWPQHTCSHCQSTLAYKLLPQPHRQLGAMRSHLTWGKTNAERMICSSPPPSLSQRDGVSEKGHSHALLVLGMALASAVWFAFPDFRVLQLHALSSHSRNGIF